MKTDVTKITGAADQIEQALKQVDKTIAYKELSGKNALHLRLLSEEMLSLMRAITNYDEGSFWIEEDAGVYSLHLKVSTFVDEKKREQLLSASTSGKNEARRGFMGKIRAFFEPDVAVPVFMGGFLPGSAPQMYGSVAWSMEDYKAQLKQFKDQQRSGAQEAWDELEKSVVAKIADDVKISITQRCVEMTITKRIA